MSTTGKTSNQKHRWMAAALLDIDRRTSHLGLDDAFGVLRSGTVDTYEAMLTSDDASEGPTAFAEKRDPIWKGR